MGGGGTCSLKNSHKNCPALASPDDANERARKRLGEEQVRSPDPAWTRPRLLLLPSMRRLTATTGPAMRHLNSAACCMFSHKVLSIFT